jgi:glycosyltransferase involved in cell wall biosynthesis
MSGDVTVSLVMPVWRPRADWLRAAVASALDEGRCSIELIIIDNGNEPSLTQLLADIITDPRIHVITIAHGGVSRARNAGMAQARGQFIRFVDCDDVLTTNSTSHLLSHASDLTIGYGATEYCDVELRPYKTVVCGLEGHIAAAALTDFSVTLPALLFPRRAIDLAGAWDESMTICEDWDFVQRALEHAAVRGDTRVAIKYRRHTTSAVGQASIELSERSAERVVSNYLQRHPDQRESRQVRRAHAMRLTEAGDRYLRIGHRSAALSRFTRALRHDPAFTVRTLSGILAREVRSRVRPDA